MMIPGGLFNKLSANGKSVTLVQTDKDLAVKTDRKTVKRFLVILKEPQTSTAQVGKCMQNALQQKNTTAHDPEHIISISEMWQ